MEYSIDYRIIRIITEIGVRSDSPDLIQGYGGGTRN